MDKEYVSEGCRLMLDFCRENKILTKERNFVSRLRRFYDSYGGLDLDGDLELRYLELERYFYNNIAPPVSNEDRASVEVLNIFSQVK